MSATVSSAMLFEDRYKLKALRRGELLVCHDDAYRLGNSKQSLSIGELLALLCLFDVVHHSEHILCFFSYIVK